MRQVLPTVGRRGRVQHRAEAPRGERDHRGLAAVGQVQRDDVATDYALPAEEAGQARRLGIEFGVTQRTAAVVLDG